MELIRYRFSSHTLDEAFRRVTAGAAETVAFDVAPDGMFRLLPFIHATRNVIRRITRCIMTAVAFNARRESFEVREVARISFRSRRTCRTFASRIYNSADNKKYQTGVQ